MNGSQPPDEPRLSTDEQRAWRAFLGAHAFTTVALDRELYGTVGLRLGDYEVLVHLAEAGEPLRMNQLAERCSLSPSGLTRRFDALVTRGWVRRSSCEEDGRGVYAALTEAGRAALDAARPAHEAAVRRLFVEAIDPAAVAQLGRSMDSIARRAAPAPAARPPVDAT